MFDRLTINPTQVRRVTEHVTINEHRAPTDESVELLKEMEEAARNKFSQSIRLNINKFECVVHTGYDAANAAQIFLVQYSLNGCRREVEYAYTDPSKNFREVIQDLVDKVTKDIAVSILKPAVDMLQFQLKKI